MRTHFAHMQVNVAAVNLPFYRDLFSFMGWLVLYDGDGMLGMQGQSDDSFWFAGQVKDVANDYDGPGVNHLAFGTDTQDEIDTAAAYLRERGWRYSLTPQDTARSSRRVRATPTIR